MSSTEVTRVSEGGRTWSSTCVVATNPRSCAEYRFCRYGGQITVFYMPHLRERSVAMAILLSDCTTIVYLRKLPPDFAAGSIVCTFMHLSHARLGFRCTLMLSACALSHFCRLLPKFSVMHARWLIPYYLSELIRVLFRVEAPFCSSGTFLFLRIKLLVLTSSLSALYILSLNAPYVAFRFLVLLHFLVGPSHQHLLSS